MTKIEEAINTLIKEEGVDTNHISDGYHTFGELYDHRIELFIALCKMIEHFRHYDTVKAWMSKYHSDGTSFDGWFILGIGDEKGKQISYHLPISEWDRCI